MVVLWSCRLGVFLWLRVCLRKRDARFDVLRASPLRFAMFWVLQAVWVFSVSLPLTLMHAAMVALPEARAWRFNLFDLIGWALFGLGFYFEVLADHQKYLYSLIPKADRPTPFITTGLWSLSRHPNYFGEICLWAGIALSAAQGVSVWSWLLAGLCVISPAITFYFLVYVSGINVAEARDDRRYGRLTALLQYRAITSPLFPVNPRIYMMIHPRIKRTFFFDRANITPGTIPLPKIKGNEPIEYSTLQTR